MEYLKLIDELIHELSYRVGVPDLKNKEHQTIISEILTEWGKVEEKYRIMSFLTEAPASDAQGEDSAYTHIGRGIYVRRGDEGKPSAQKYKQSASGQLQPISQDEYDQMKGDQGAEGEEAAADANAQTAAQAGGGQPEKPETGQSLSAPEYQDQINKEKEVQNQIEKEKASKTTPVKKTPEELEANDKSKVQTQILMTQAEAEQSQEGVGLGTAESRTGESVTVYAGQKIQELMKSGKSYEEARDEVETYLLTIANNKDYVLTKEWVKSGLAVFDYMNDTIGIDNIEHFAWDTPDGNELVGSTGHGTSADMFVKTDDGGIIGVSLKKDFKVFIVNGGYGKAMKEFEQKVGVNLPENCQTSNYTKRRDDEYNTGKETVKSNRKDFEEAAQRLLDDEEYFNKVFGPKAQSFEKRKRYIEKKLGISNWKDATPQQLVDLLINENKKSTGDDLKFFAAFNKEAGVKEKFGIYPKLRNLDNEMTENIFNFFQGSESAKSKYKEKIIEDTHILDTLFPNPPLTDFKTIFGTAPAVEMTREAVGSIFGVSDLMKDYENAKTDDEKKAIRELIENEIKKKLVITKKKGVPVIAINLDGPPQSELPLYKLGVRTRGIGNAQTLEVSQETFGSLALKNGNTNVSEWSDKDRRTVVEQESKDMLALFEDEDFDISDLSPEEMQDFKERIVLLKTWYPKSPTLKKLGQYIE
jgi:hypothetical protein